MATNNDITLSRAPHLNLRPLLLLIGVAVAAAAGVAILLWWRGPSWTLLYGNLAASDASQVTQALDTAGIQYKLNDSNGAIMVAADQVYAARLKLAAQGLPESGSGIDLISKESGLGVSQFMETARYQYALESELARSVAALRGVEAARVHLAMSQQSVFVRDRRPATASVLVQLRPGARLDTEQVQAIVHLVASSIPELDARQVTVVDQQGRLLSSPDTGVSSTGGEQFDATQRLEETYVQRIEQLLAPMVGVGSVRAQVSIDLDVQSLEQTREQYAPNTAVVRSEQTSEENNSSTATQVAGVPGSLSNQPPVGGTAVPATTANNGTTTAATAAGGAAAAGTASTATVQTNTPEHSAKSATRNFEIDRTLSYTKQPGGRVKRLTVAVLLDNLHKVGTDGKSTAQPLAAEQIENITKLVKSAVGFDEARGDTVSVVNAAFQNESEVLQPEVLPIWQRPWVQDVARLVLGALVLLALALGVLRPLVRNLTAQTTTRPGTRPAGAMAVGEDGSELQPAGAVAGSAGNAALVFEQQVAQARNLVAQDPKRVAQVVKTWVGDR